MLKFVNVSDLKPLVRDTLGRGTFSMSPLPGGLLNQNLVVQTDNERFVLKVFNDGMPREKVDEMHRAMRHAATFGVPIPLPIATYEMHGFAAGLYPFVPGEHPPLFGHDGKTIRATGEMLGRIDHALESFRPRTPKPKSLELAKWSPEKTLGEIEELRQVLRRKPRKMREAVEPTFVIYEKIIAAGNWDKKPFANLPVRVIHGDYKGNNLFVQDGAVTAVIDWEKVGWGWRGFEVSRSVLFHCRRSNNELDWDEIRAYLKGYRKFVTLSDLERERAYDCGVYRMFFSLWAVKQYVGGHINTHDNVIRRAALLPYLFKNREKFSERMAKLLR